jgi:hypothetical protein
MTGQIIGTHMNGGMIRNDADGRAVSFKWCECQDFGPNDSGFGTKVRFYLAVVSGRENAIAVRREEQ